MFPVRMVALVLIIIPAVLSALQVDTEDEGLATNRAIYRFLDGLDTKLKRQLLLKHEREEQKLKKMRDEMAKAEEDLKEIDEEWRRVQQESDNTRARRKKQKRACVNKMQGGRCQLLRWFGKGCSGKKMMEKCRATCRLCR